MFASRFSLCSGLALLPILASAQESPSDSLPFHQHQWAAQFGGGTSFAGLGFLRFTAPRRAWLLDFHFTGGHSHDYQYANDTLTGQGLTSNATVDARIGRRFYQSRGRSIESFQTVGALGGFAHSCLEVTPPTVGSCANGWTAGVFGEVGAAYLITRRFSIGGAATMAFSIREPL